MLRIVDNEYHDPSPKMAVFPTDSVCDNSHRRVWTGLPQWRDYHCGPEGRPRTWLAKWSHGWQEQAKEQAQAGQDFVSNLEI